MKMSPVMAGYREAETSAQRVVYAAFGCPEETLPAVEAADRLMVRYEAEHAYRGLWESGHADYPRITSAESAAIEAIMGPWRFWDWREAKHRWLALARDIELVVR